MRIIIQKSNQCAQHIKNKQKKLTSDAIHILLSKHALSKKKIYFETEKLYFELNNSLYEQSIYARCVIIKMWIDYLYAKESIIHVIACTKFKNNTKPLLIHFEVNCDFINLRQNMECEYCHKHIKNNVSLENCEQTNNNKMLKYCKKKDKKVKQKKKMKKCAKCQVVYYCSKSCQKKHWKISHHFTCTLLKNKMNHCYNMMQLAAINQ